MSGEELDDWVWVGRETAGARSWFESKSDIFPIFLSLSVCNGQYVVNKDASDSPLERFLLEKQDYKQPMLVNYWSKSLRNPERNYRTIDTKFVVVMWSVLTLRPYLEETHFIIRTNHQSFWLLLVLENYTARVAIWRFRSLEYVFISLHLLDAYHQATDANLRLSMDKSQKDDCSVDETKASRRCILAAMTIGQVYQYCTCKKTRNGACKREMNVNLTYNRSIHTTYTTRDKV